MQPKIYNITLELLQNNFYKEMILKDMTNNYYWSEGWSTELYIELCKLGFISTTYDTKEGLVLLPEIQFEYAILDFENLHISKKIQKLINKKNAFLSFNTRINEVIEGFASQHQHNWFKGEYVKLIHQLFKEDNDNFEMCCVELVCNETNKLIAGEIGYIIGKTYTSLSGFSSKETKYSNYGKLQLTLLSQYLHNRNFKFWNLGHPHMEYKKKLGCITYSREKFLERWEEAINTNL